MDVPFTAASAFAIEPPIQPMLAKVAEQLPAGAAYLFEPKWDGFRAIVFRGGSAVYMQSRDSRPLDRYFPELQDALINRLPSGCVVDGEIVIATSDGLDFDAASGAERPGETDWRVLATVVLTEAGYRATLD